MKIESIKPFSGEMIYMEGGEWQQYVRYSSDIWAVIMGQSEEPIDNHKHYIELEALYQEYKISN